jgi:hypothetical protein
MVSFVPSNSETKMDQIAHLIFALALLAALVDIAALPHSKNRRAAVTALCAALAVAVAYFFGAPL